MSAVVTPQGSTHFAVLDGWRAVSILLVLAGHLLPLGAGPIQLNAPIAAMGMVLFFILSGFLITTTLANNLDLRIFIVRRLFRIVPLAWVVMIILLVLAKAPIDTWLGNLLFYANLPPQRLVEGGGHLWSLCVEMQFYLGIAVFVAVLGRRALIALPLLALAITAARIVAGRYVDIVTWYRCDEILAGGTLAIAYAGWYGDRVQKWLAWLSPYWLLPLLLLSAHPIGGPLNYARPYIAAATIGATLYAPPPLLARLFATKAASYIATTSYAIYIFHMALAATWLGSGGTMVKYAKRPLLLALTFAIAHLSTFHFDWPCIALAKRLTRHIKTRPAA